MDKKYLFTLFTLFTLFLSKYKKFIFVKNTLNYKSIFNCCVKYIYILLYYLLYKIYFFFDKNGNNKKSNIFGSWLSY